MDTINVINVGGIDKEIEDTVARASGESADSRLDTLEPKVTNEITNRTNADASLQSQIDQIVAPTGTAPNPAEIENARITVHNKTKPTLGEAIRSQVDEIQTFLKDSFQIIDYVTGELTSNGEYKKVYLEPSSQYVIYVYDVVGRFSVFDFKTDGSYTTLLDINSYTGDDSGIFQPVTSSAHSYLRLYGWPGSGTRASAKCIIMNFKC